MRLRLLCLCCRLRKIYIGERMSLEPAAGPENIQAAALMGNSVSAWQKHYDINCSVRETQAAADLSVQWRKSMLEKGRQRAPAQQEQDLGEI